jgi:hypothetical protein
VNQRHAFDEHPSSRVKSTRELTNDNGEAERGENNQMDGGPERGCDNCMGLVKRF